MKGLRDAPVDVTLVDANNFHTFQPLLYQVASAGLDVDDVAYPVRGIFRRQRNVAVRMARVRPASTSTGGRSSSTGATRCPTTTSIIAAGAVSADYGVPGVREHAFPMKSVDDAVRLRRSILDRLERVAAGPDAPSEGELSVVICGGGPTGVEVAGALQELFDKVIGRDFPRTEVAMIDVTLVEAADRLLGTFSHLSSERALRTLTRRGVSVVLGTGVDHVTAEGVFLADGRFLPAWTVVWTAGRDCRPDRRGGRPRAVPGRAPGRGAGPVGARAGPRCSPSATSPRRPTTTGSSFPRSRSPPSRAAATRPARSCAASTVCPGLPFRYRDRGSMATIGRNEAVTELPFGVRLWGSSAGWRGSGST